MTARYPRGADLPGTGFAAGPCLFKDTMQLSALTNNQFFIGHASMLVNEGLPQFVIKQMKSRYPLRDMTVGILVWSFKANIDDMRDSLSLKLRDLLEMEAKGTICSEPFVHFPGFVDCRGGREKGRRTSRRDPSRAVQTLQLHGKPVFDIWNVLPEQKEPVRQAFVKILLTGSSGFIAGYLVNELLAHGHEVVGSIIFPSTGPVKRSYDSNPRYSFVEADAKDVAVLKRLLSDCDVLIASAAKIGGISYFHKLAYDLIAENERITAAQFDAAIWAHAKGTLERIVVILVLDGI